MITKKLNKLIQKLETRSNEISDERKDLLNSFADYISRKVNRSEKVELIFICTHNSRRSHMGQIWAQCAAEFYNIPDVRCYSGGTEVTVFNLRAVKTVITAGFKVEKLDDEKNPIYFVSYAHDQEPLSCFSKIYSDPFNPQTNFAAIMTCSDADKNCPMVLGAEKRFSIKYDDPKEYDGTELEEKKYMERFEQIGIEMIYTFSKVVE